MDNVKKTFLDTGMSHIECMKIILEELRDSFEHLVYTVKRYDVPVVLLMFYSKENISEFLEDTKRLTDVVKVIKIGNGYFSFTYLLFTDLEGCDKFIKHIEYNKLQNIEYKFTYEELTSDETQFYNFINSYLFQIEEGD
jgi:hypothetical protein